MLSRKIKQDKDLETYKEEDDILALTVGESLRRFKQKPE